MKLANNNKMNTNVKGIKEAKVSHLEKLIFLLEEQYQHPLRTLVQEYLSNAKDACVKANTPIKIEVTLPTFENPLLKIRDYGTGMSEQEIEDVFFSYGASTKDQSNDEIGGFGVGGKSAFAYTDQLIITGFKNGKVAKFHGHKQGRKTQYVQILSEDTNEQNGVSIEVPLKAQSLNEDMSAVLRYVFRATALWKEKPTILNLDYFKSTPHPSFEDLTDSIKYTTKNCMILSKKSEAFKDISSHFVVDIGGIPYGINPKAFNLEVFSKISQLFKETQNQFYIGGKAQRKNEYDWQIVAKANIGDFSLPVSREEIKIDEHSKKSANELFTKVLTDILALIAEETKNLKTYKEAFAFFDHPFFRVPEVKVCDKNYSFSIKAPEETNHYHRKESPKLSINTRQEFKEFYKKGASDSISVANRTNPHWHLVINKDTKVMVINDSEDSDSILRKKLKHHFINEMEGFLKKYVVRGEEESCYGGIVVLPSNTNDDLQTFLKNSFDLYKASELTYEKNEPSNKKAKQKDDKTIVKAVIYSTQYSPQKSIPHCDFDYKNYLIFTTTNNAAQDVKDKNGIELNGEKIKIINSYLMANNSPKRIVGVSSAQMKKLNQDKIKEVSSYDFKQWAEIDKKLMISIINKTLGKKLFKWKHFAMAKFECKILTDLISYITEPAERHATYLTPFEALVSQEPEFKELEQIVADIEVAALNKYPLVGACDKIQDISIKEELAFYIKKKHQEKV